MKRIYRLTAFTIAVLLLFVLTACGKENPSGTPKDASASGSSAETRQNEPETPETEDREKAEPASEESAGSQEENVPADGVYEVEVTLTGGTGRASVGSPAKLSVKDGKMTATVVWSSSNYDYMIVDEVKYLPVTLEGGSTFEIPVAALDTELPVVGDTVAMSTPHEISYTLRFDSSTMKAAEEAK